MDTSFTSDERLLINSRIFTDAQVKHIKNMRHQYESKIERKDKQAFISYIDSEKKILQKIQQHIKKKGDPLTQQIILRIVRIHNIALSHFEDELKFWISSLKFCLETNHHEFISKNKLKKLLDLHKNNENVWLLAAKWEENKFDNKKQALNYLYKGLNQCPTSTKIYLNILRLIFKTANSVENESEAIELFKKSMKENLNLEFYIEFLKTATEFDQKRLQFLICEFLIENFSKSNEIWHILAQRELDGHHITESGYEMIKNEEERIENCLKIYERSIKALSTEEMWEKYLDALDDLRERFKTNHKITESFISACNEAHNKSFMTEKHYILWLKCLKDSENISEILETATKRRPKSLELWDARIKFHFNKKEFKAINKIFDESIQILGDDSGFIWKRKIQYYQLIHQMKPETKITLQNERIKNIFNEGIKFSDKVSDELQPLFLEWVSLTHDREETIKLYKELSKRDKICLELHKKMAELESMTSNPNEEIFNEILNNLRKNPDALKQFQEFISQEIHYGPSWKSTTYKKFLNPS